jgi:maltose alpha-D-glucosyltransferase/alpha-amylase
MASRRSIEDLEVVYTFLLTMPGVPVIYYGDEIGMRTIEGLPSKEGGYGRTGARTPMQWDSSANLGFSSAPAADLYLPVDPDPDGRTVSAQQDDPASLLNRVRRLVALRKAHPALANGAAFDLVYGEYGRYPLVYRRWSGDETLLVAVNPSAAPVSVALPAGLVTAAPATLHGCDGALAENAGQWTLSLPGVSAGVYRV